MIIVYDQSLETLEQKTTVGRLFLVLWQKPSDGGELAAALG